MSNFHSITRSVNSNNSNFATRHNKKREPNHRINENQYSTLFATFN